MESGGTSIKWSVEQGAALKLDYKKGIPIFSKRDYSVL